MGPEQDIARLNLTLEFFSECARIVELDGLLQALAARLRWILEFERCSFVYEAEGESRYWTIGQGAIAFSKVQPEDLPADHRTVLTEVQKTRAPALGSGGQLHLIGYPVGEPKRPYGALCVSDPRQAYSYRDLRFIYHICESVGAVLARIEGIASLAGERRTSRLHRESADRDRSARQRAEAAARTKDDVLAMLGHELRNPLAPIVNAVAILRKRAGSPSAELDILDRQSRHLHRLLDDLLDVSRLATGKVTLNRTMVDLRSIISRAMEMVQPLVEEKRQALALESPATPVMLAADEARLLQVFSNIMNNAAQFTPSGGRIEISVRSVGGSAIVSVKDNGVGIEPMILARIFDSFVQGGLGHDRKQGGLGLGLSVARALVNLHGGKIEAGSGGLGQGSCFTVFLPFESDAARLTMGAPRHSAAPMISVVPCKILLVDDNRDAAESLATLLREAGHEVSVAYEPTRALELVQSELPEIVVLDIGLPEMDGYELADAMRARMVGRGPSLIALTGYGQESDRERSAKAGFSRHLVKPVEAMELLHAIAQLRPAKQ